jgi:hypothetical protein
MVVTYSVHFVQPDKCNQTTHTDFLTNCELNKTQTHVIIRFSFCMVSLCVLLPCVSAKIAEFFILL